VILFGFLMIGGLGQASAADVINWKFQSHHRPARFRRPSSSAFHRAGA
jgi:hypothetical protein